MKVTKKTTSVNLPKIEILNKLGKRKNSKRENTKKLPSQNQKLQLVPWKSSSEWDDTCKLFAADDYNGMMDRLLIWQASVPSLPVGVEGTLFLVQALQFHSKIDCFNPEENLQARTLYSLALIRFLNHMSHLATQAVGGIGLPMFQLVSQMNIPSWLVDIRHEATHGANLPSLASLQDAGAFIKTWLQENYWIPTAESTEPLLPEVVEADTVNIDEEEDEDTVVSSTASEVISAFVACRVYFLRQASTITDSEVTKFWPHRTKSLSTKEALRGLKHTINIFLSKRPTVTCAIIASELIPTPEFYRDFTSIFSFKPMNKLRLVWNPILKLIQRKGQLGGLCVELVKIHGSSTSSNSEWWSAIWTKRILTMMTTTGTDWSDELFSSVLPIAMKSPNGYSQIFMKRLFRLVKPRMGIAYSRKIQALSDIWTEPLDFDFEKKSNRNIVTLEEIISDRPVPESDISISATSLRILDERSSEFWQKQPLGQIFG